MLRFFLGIAHFPNAIGMVFSACLSAKESNERKQWNKIDDRLVLNQLRGTWIISGETTSGIATKANLRKRIASRGGHTKPLWRIRLVALKVCTRYLNPVMRLVSPSHERGEH
jgi:hypothetical protein